MEDSMYRRLLLLPIFNGLTTEELTQIISQIHLDFRQYGDGEAIVCQDDRCDRILYVLNGKIRSEYADPESRFIVTEVIDKPFVVEPYNLFGMSQRYEHSYVTIEPSDTVTINKRDFNNIMLNYHIVKTNILNMFCAKIQRLTKMTRECEPESVEKKIVRFLQCHTLNGKGYKTLQIRMEDLASLIKETRLNVSFALRNMNQQGYILQPHRSTIVVPDMQMLITSIS
jgi:CRP-like cAMP-binding protein